MECYSFPVFVDSAQVLQAPSVLTESCSLSTHPLTLSLKGQRGIIGIGMREKKKKVLQLFFSPVNSFWKINVWKLWKEDCEHCHFFVWRSTSVTSWTRQALWQKSTWHYEPTFFLSSMVKSPPARLHPKDKRFEGKKYFCHRSVDSMAIRHTEPADWNSGVFSVFADQLVFLFGVPFKTAAEICRLSCDSWQHYSRAMVVPDRSVADPHNLQNQK